MGRICELCRKMCGRKKRRKAGILKLTTAGMINVEVPKEPIPKISIEELNPNYKDLDQMYRHAVQTMVNFVGKPSYPFNSHPKQLYPYILNLCEGIDENNYIDIKNSIKREVKDLQVIVVLKEAKIIHPKWSEFSNVYCKVWINEGCAKLSAIKDNTSNLLWNEIFIFDVESYEFDSMHLEVWSSRPGRFSQMLQSNPECIDNDPLAGYSGDYFVGDIIQKIQHMSCVGDDVHWILRKGSAVVSTRGQVKAYVQLCCKKRKDYYLQFHIHMAFLRMCYEKQVEATNHSSLWKNWLEILPNAALTLIQQHALQNGITLVEQILCSWLVTSSLKMRKEDRISFYLLNVLLDQVSDNDDQDIFGELQEVLDNSFVEFFDFTNGMLKNMHKHFDVLCVEMADELFYMLRCMIRTENFSFNYLDSYEILKEEARLWYLQVLTEYRGPLEEEEEEVEKTAEALKNVVKVYLRNQIILDDIFKRAWAVNYSSIANKALDEVLCTVIKPIVEHLMVIIENPERTRKASESLKMLQLYHDVRSLVNYLIVHLSKKKVHQNLEDYSMWFGKKLILEWFLLCDIYTKPFIKRAVLSDTLERINKNVVYSTSVPDVKSIIDEIVVDVWMKLSLEDQFYTHGALIEAMRSCVLEYAKSIAERDELSKCSWNMTGINVDSKICVALSNVYALSEHLYKTKLKVKSILKNVEASYNFTMTDLMATVENDLQLLMSEIFLSAVNKISECTKTYVKQMVRSKYSLMVSRKIHYFIEDTLETLYLNLKQEPFHVILRQLWIMLLLVLQQGFQYSRTCCTLWMIQPNVCLILVNALEQLMKTFYCDGHGLSYYEMENPTYKEFKERLDNKLRKKIK